MTSPNAFTNLRGPDPLANRQTDAISRLVEPVCKTVMATPIMGAAPPAWIRPPLENGFSDTGGSNVPLRHHRDALGYVHVQAHVRTPGGAAASTTITTLPPGYRPAFDLVFTAKATAGFDVVRLYPSGILASGAALAAGESLGFSISFLAER